MRGILLFVMLFLSPALALAGKTDPTWNPPARFDHAYAGKLIIHHLPQPQIVKICAKVLGNLSMTQHGCASLVNGGCTIWMTGKTYMGATPKAVLRHETGHCNGWPADHPN